VATSKNAKGVILINPNWRELKTKGRMCALNHPVSPIDLQYLSDDFNRKNIKNHILDMWADSSGIYNYDVELEAAKYIIVSTAPSYLYWRDGTIDYSIIPKLVEDIRLYSSAKIILIGPHGTVTPKPMMGFGDYVVRGEPELSVYKIIKKANINLKQYQTVSDLNNLPELSYSQLDFNKYRLTEGNDVIKGALYETSRGCPYSCSFCFREGFRKELRLKTAHRVWDELCEIRSQPIKNIYLIDECFGVNPWWAEEIIDKLVSSGLSYGFQTRPDILTPQFIESLDNCRFVYLGIEHVDPIALRFLGKKEWDLEELETNLGLLLDKGIKPFLSFTIGVPTYNEDFVALEDFIDGLDKRIQGDVHPLIHYPGTEMWRDANLPLDWSIVPQHIGTLGNTFTRQEIFSEAKRLSKKFYSRQPILSRASKKVKSWLKMY